MSPCPGCVAQDSRGPGAHPCAPPVCCSLGQMDHVMVRFWSSVDFSIHSKCAKRLWITQQGGSSGTAHVSNRQTDQGKNNRHPLHTSDKSRGRRTPDPSQKRPKRGNFCRQNPTCKLHSEASKDFLEELTVAKTVETQGKRTETKRSHVLGTDF